MRGDKSCWAPADNEGRKAWKWTGMVALPLSLGVDKTWIDVGHYLYCRRVYEVSDDCCYNPGYGKERSHSGCF